jgi:hypothetical protein
MRDIDSESRLQVVMYKIEPEFLNRVSSLHPTLVSFIKREDFNVAGDG